MKAIADLEHLAIEYMKREKPLARIYSRELVDTIFQRPYCRVATLVNADLCQRQTAMKYLTILSDFGILKLLDLGRERLFINTRLMDLLKNEDHSFESY